MRYEVEFTSETKINSVGSGMSTAQVSLTFRSSRFLQVAVSEELFVRGRGSDFVDTRVADDVTVHDATMLADDDPILELDKERLTLAEYELLTATVKDRVPIFELDIDEL
eukprot:GILI01074582.1.p2 GENE.GILI01074582.1~~GILI01074582.1.p2  ORF type:complete len:110 (+),score=7.53 GILI01074582.1:1-330(+)